MAKRRNEWMTWVWDYKDQTLQYEATLIEARQMRLYIDTMNIYMYIFNCWYQSTL